MEWRLPDLDLCCERMERWRILHRSLWSQVCTAHHAFPFLALTDRSPRFERELEALRKELAENNNRSGCSSPPFTDVESLSNTPFIDNSALPPVDDSVAVGNDTLEARKDQ